MPSLLTDLRRELSAIAELMHPRSLSPSKEALARTSKLSDETLLQITALALVDPNGLRGTFERFRRAGDPRFKYRGLAKSSVSVKHLSMRLDQSVLACARTAVDISAIVTVLQGDFRGNNGWDEACDIAHEHVSRYADDGLFELIFQLSIFDPTDPGKVPCTAREAQMAEGAVSIYFFLEQERATTQHAKLAWEGRVLKLVESLPAKLASA